jgi:ubiquitin C-terminal hydrolase
MSQIRVATEYIPLLACLLPQVCGRVSHCFDPFLNLTIPVARPRKLRGAVTLGECFAAFGEEETLAGSEGYKCSACHKVQPASKRMRLYRWPQVCGRRAQRVMWYCLVCAFVPCQRGKIC